MVFQIHTVLIQKVRQDKTKDDKGTRKRRKTFEESK